MDSQHQEDQAPPERAAAQEQSGAAAGNAAAGNVVAGNVAGAGPAATGADGGGDGRQAASAAYAEGTRDKVRGRDYAGGQEILAPAPLGGGYAQTKAGMQPQGAADPAAPLPTVPAADVAGKIVALLSYGWTDVVITDAEATEAFRLLSIAGDKQQVFQRMKSEGVYERLWQNLPKAAVTANFQRTLSVYTALPEQEKIARMTSLLSYGLTDWAVDDREMHLLIEVLDTMSPAGRQTFIQHDGGGWYARLMGQQLSEQAPPNQAPEAPTWMEQLESAATTGTDFIKAVAADPQGALDKVKEGGSQLAALLGEGELDLNYAEKVAGGSMGGLDLNEAGDNTLDGDLDTDAGTFEIHIENLLLNSISHTSGDTTVTTGGGAITGVHGTLKWATAQDSASGLELNVDGLAMTDIEVTADALEVSLALITFQALHLAAANPDASATPTTPIEAAQLAGQELILLAEDWVPAMSALGTAPGQNPDVISARIAENLPAAMRYEMSLGSALISNLEYRELNDNDEMAVVAKVGEARIGGVAVTLEHRESVAVLKQEQAALMSKGADKLGAAERDRLAFIETELVALTAIGQRAEELEAMQTAGTALTPAQEDELIRANNRLRTGVVTVEAKLIEIKDAEVDGKSVDHAVVSDLKGQVAGAAVGYNALDSEATAAAAAQQLKADSGALDHLLDKAKRPDQVHENDRAREAEQAREAKLQAEADKQARADLGIPEPGPMDGLSASISIADASVTGLNTGDGEVGQADLHGLSASAAEDASQLKLASADVSNATGSASGAKMSLLGGHVAGVDLHQNGGDVGGYVQDMSADGLAAQKDGMEVGVDHGALHGVRFDGNTDSALLRSGSIETADATGARYGDGTTTATVDQLSAQGMSATGATAEGAATIGLAGGQLQGAHAQVGSKTIDVGAATMTDLDATGLSTSGASTLGVGGATVNNASFADGGTSGSVDALQVAGIAGQDLNADGTGSVQADRITAQGLGGVSDGSAGTVKSLDVHGAHATANAAGTVAGVKSAEATGIAGQYGDAASGSLGSVSVGESSVALDAGGNLVGAQVAGLSMSDIKARVIPAKLGGEVAGDEAVAANGADGAPAASDAFHADALGHASGTFHAWMDVTYGPDALMGAIDVTATAHDGMIDMKDIKIRGSGLAGIFGRIGFASVKIEPGRGIVAEFGLARIIFADTRDYDGMLSRREGGGRKGTLLLQPFSESVMNGKVELSEEGRAALLASSTRDLSREDRRTRREMEQASRQEQRADRRADRRERHGRAPVEAPAEAELSGLETMEQYVDVGTAKVDLSGLKMGDGLVGYDSAHATLDRGGDQGANVFEVHTTLGQSATASAQRIRAKDLHATGPGGEPLDASKLGIDGLQIDVLKPLSTNYAVTLGIDGLNVTDIRFGDTSKLDEP